MVPSRKIVMPAPQLGQRPAVPSDVSFSVGAPNANRLEGHRKKRVDISRTSPIKSIS